MYYNVDSLSVRGSSLQEVLTQTQGTYQWSKFKEFIDDCSLRPSVSKVLGVMIVCGLSSLFEINISLIDLIDNKRLE